MYPIDTVTATDDNKFVNGDSTVVPPVLPTALSAEWCNCIQEELLNILAGLEISPNAANNAQIWDCLKTIGVRAIYSEGDVTASGFDGSIIIFHSASSFNIGTLKTRSLIIVVPMWGDDSPASIVIHYGSQNHQIKKGFFFIGMAANGSVEDLSLIGIDLPRAFNGNDLNLGVLNASKVKASKRFEMDLVTFEYSDDVDPETGLEDWRAWQMAENWEVNQTKRVYCTNVATVRNVPIYYDASSSWKNVPFYKNGYREFVCVGTRSVTDGETTRVYAILLCNGGAYTESQT